MNLDSVSQELDRLYEFEISQYISRCDELKKSGYKIYRNSNGQHKVVLAGQQVNRRQERNTYETTKPKKENILVRAKKKIHRTVENTKTVINFIKVLRASQKNSKM